LRSVDDFLRSRRSGGQAESVAIWFAARKKVESNDFRFSSPVRESRSFSSISPRR
jgi:hypothetical protein